MLHALINDDLSIVVANSGGGGGGKGVAHPSGGGRFGSYSTVWQFGRDEADDG